MRIIYDPIPENSTAVKFLPDDHDPAWCSGMNVTDLGDELWLSHFIGEPIPAREWRAAAKERYPNARVARWRRKNAGRDREGWARL